MTSYTIQLTGTLSGPTAADPIGSFETAGIFGSPNTSLLGDQYNITISFDTAYLMNQSVLYGDAWTNILPSGTSVPVPAAAFQATVTVNGQSVADSAALDGGLSVSEQALPPSLSGTGSDTYDFIGSVVAEDPAGEFLIVGFGFGTSDNIGTAFNPFTYSASEGLPASGSQVIVTTATGLADIDAGNLPSTTNTEAILLGDPSTVSLTENGLCFCTGTLIATLNGEVAVEQLVVGTKVLTARGEVRRVVWIGHGRILATRNRRNAATPVIVRKGALGNNVPHRDLRVTKGHSFYIEDVLIPVQFLVNHRSILWDDHAQEVNLHHIELETHDVLLANGAPAESYRDDGNRWLFQNANTGWHLPPREPCAPVLTGGPVVDALWWRLLQRAGPRQGLPLTEDADLHLLADGRRLDAVERIEQAFVFRLLTMPSALHITSRAAAPAELGLARDPRVLGVALRLLVVRTGTRFRVTEANDHRLTDGFHAFEPANGFRWTDGAAAVPADLYAGLPAPFELVLYVGATSHYLADDRCVHRVA
jgi:hypothetical protein